MKPTAIAAIVTVAVNVARIVSGVEECLLSQKTRAAPARANAQAQLRSSQPPNLLAEPIFKVVSISVPGRSDGVITFIVPDPLAFR